MNLHQVMERFQARMPEIIDFGQIGIAAGILAVAFLLAYLIGHAAAPRIGRLFEGPEEEVRIQRLVGLSDLIIRNLITGLVAAIALFTYPWQLYSELMLGLALAWLFAHMVHRILRALGIGFWTSLAASLILFSMFLSRSIGGIAPVSQLLDHVDFFIGQRRFSLQMLVNFVFIGIILVALVRAANRLVRFLLNRNSEFDAAQRVLGEKLAMVGISVAAFFVAIDMLGIDLTAFAIFSGAFGLAIGFGLQKTFGNLIAGIILLMDRSIKPGDVIAVGDSFGWVNKIGIRAVSIVTRDGKEHLIPNESLMTEAVENWSYSSKNVRVRIPVGVSYSADMDKVEALLRQAAVESGRVLKRPAPNVWMKEFGDNSVNFEILAWIADPEEGVGNVRSDVLKRVWRLFLENNIEIPFPQRDLNLRNISPELLEKLGGQGEMIRP